MNKIYILVFDPYKTNSMALHEVIKNSPYALTWWHFIGSAYLIKSQYTLGTIHQQILNEWPNQFFMLTEVDLKNSDGWLPKEAWDWIKLHR